MAGQEVTRDQLAELLNEDLSREYGAASPLGDADSDPEALITAIYRTYTDIAPGEDGVPNV